MEDPNGLEDNDNPEEEKVAPVFRLARDPQQHDIAHQDALDGKSERQYIDDDDGALQPTLELLEIIGPSQGTRYDQRAAVNDQGNQGQQGT